SSDLAGPAIVRYAVEIVVEATVALHEAEAARIVVSERRCRRARWIVERSPDPLAGPAPHGQSVRVVHLGAPVDPLRLLLLRVPVHRGEWRNAKPLDVAAQMDLIVDVHGHRLVA